jgi:hypothetical protein
MINEVELSFDHFIQNTPRLWDLETAKRLVEIKWLVLKSTGLFSSQSEYSTAAWLSKKHNPDIARFGLGERLGLDMNLEDYSKEYIKGFYSKNGLTPFDLDELLSIKEKLEAALSLFDYPGGPLDSINLLVRSIHVVQQNHPEIDISHSDPEIPFSIFVSVCNATTPISNLRVAESILHEAMHLQLTLLEAVVPLVKASSKETFYSPWRDQHRPIRGVLHGVFVFKAIKDFYYSMLSKTDNILEVQNYLTQRVEVIQHEINSVETIKKSMDLTRKGKMLVSQLLNDNVIM